ncbi:MurR/RpiR family transcriptional regulator [Brochothrix campestris]|uniref:Putative transcriptional regulator n=1 Tax=Brochothrix campestris FSL F6-1037 TaxID=1265861 RepID=W7CNJ0_9LIST|nr:MurR/RpiR family transcriptional regulator [Brochothrix campestris]EUJ38622.1 putative transcriptional regulator [Brochothrix campestris FSL F6-1037]
MFTTAVIKQFTEIEQQLYRYIRDNREQVMYMRVRELAEATQVSAATIVRFTRKIGCEGFSEFKLRLKEEAKLPVPEKLNNTVKVANDFFSRDLTADYEAVFEQAVALIKTSELVVFFGIGTSGILAEYGSRYFSNLDQRTFFVKDPFYPTVGRPFKKSVMIILSVSGETEQVLEQARNMLSNGSKVISITNTAHNTLASLSDINLSYYVPQEKMTHANITTQLPVLFLLEALAKRNYEELYKEK